MISEFKGTYSFLSNFHPWGFEFRGIWMPSAEHAFQAFKAKYPQDMLYVASAPTPGKAKARGRRISLRHDWESYKLPLMLEIIHIKFMPDDRRELLKATAPHKLVEGNYWHDQFWGNCMCSSHPEPGKNYLGKILMKVRSLT